jgi:hypothetical protein
VGPDAVGSARVTIQPGPQHQPSSLHPRLTVARASSDQRAALVTAAGPLVLGPDDLLAAAQRMALDRAPERTAVRARLDAAAARLQHDVATATSRLDHLEDTRRELVEGADWALRAEAELPDQLAAIDDARNVLDARQVEQRAARAGLERVLEQRAAAAAAMEDAERQLGELVGAGMDESSLRRELEAAGHAVRAAHAAFDAATARVEELEDELGALRHRLHELGPVELDADEPGLPAPADVERVRAALAAWVEAARHVDLDPDALALADAFTDLNADLEELLRQAGPTPDQAEVQAAQARVDQAAEELARIEAAAAAASLTPADRAAIDAAHAKVVQLEERSDRRLGAGSARRHLESARAEERALLDRFGFDSYLAVVLTGGRSVTTAPERLAAERSYLAAKANRNRVLAALQLTPEREYLESERARLLTHAVEVLGVDPGERVIELLRAHPFVDRSYVEDLRDAMAQVGRHPVGTALDVAAGEWLQAQDEHAARWHDAHDAAARADQERAEITERAAQLEVELVAARDAQAQARAAADVAGRSVGTFENELSARADEDANRIKRFAAAEQLRHQVEALTATLTRAEQAAREALDEATEAVVAAEVALDRAQSATTEVSRTARALAGRLPIDQRPEGEHLGSLGLLADRLRAHALVVEPEIEAARDAVAAASVRVAEARAEAEAAGTGDDGPREIDLRDGFAAMLEDRGGAPVVLDEPFTGVDDITRAALLALLVERQSEAPVVLLTNAAEVLGWAIELPAADGTVAPADSLLNPLRSLADTQGTHPIRALRDADPTAPTSPAHPAGRT